MVSKHQRHLMDIERRKKARMANEIEHSNQPNNQQETVMHSYIDKAKKFYGQHKKAVNTVGGILAAAALVVVAHKVARNININNTVKAFGSTVSFKPASMKAVKKEMKLELKGSTKRNLQRAMFKFPKTNHYVVNQDGSVVNTLTKRIVKPVLDTAGEKWTIGFVDDNHFEVGTVQKLVDAFWPALEVVDVQVKS